MKVTYEERPLEELENEIVEYIINTPNNANPNVVRTMISSAGEKVGASGSKPVYFRLDFSTADTIDRVVNYKTGEDANMEEVILAGLSGNGFMCLNLKNNGANNWATEDSLLPQLITGFAISNSNAVGVKTTSAQYHYRGTNIAAEYVNIVNNYFANL